MSGSTTMEGYLYKKGHTLPTMHRRYCVLKGTMLSYYTSADEYARKQTPRNVLEVIGVKDLGDSSGGGGGGGILTSPSKKKKHAFEIEYLGGTTYECHADSREEKLQWLTTLQHALDEPNRIVQDEIEDAQRHLQAEAEHEAEAMAQASEAVHAAQRFVDDALAMDLTIKTTKNERLTLDEQRQLAVVRLEEAKTRTQQTQAALYTTRTKAHDMALTADNVDAEGGEDEDAMSTISSTAVDELADRVARLAAQLEVDRTNEATQLQTITDIDKQIAENETKLEEYKLRARQYAEEGRKLRESAASSLQSAHTAKQLSRLRVSSWTASSSHLDPLVEGYLLCKHPFKPSMHRRYCVLFGNTLCWYKDADDYTQNMQLPGGVVHVAAVAEWSGKVGGMKTFPHAFAVATVEGKTLYCSAPLKQSAVTWETALHIGLAMPALSPHRAMQAKARRDSFDLLTASPTKGPMQRRASLAYIAATEETKDSEPPRSSESMDKSVPPPIDAAVEPELPVLVEGYLVKKSSLFPVMKKKYCVLKGLGLSILDSHEESKAKRDHDQVLVCGISDWDGHGALLQYHHGFQIHTVAHDLIQCSAANANEKAKWMAGIHEALLKYKDQSLSPTRREDATLAQTRVDILHTLKGDTTENVSPRSHFRARIQAFYVDHHATKVHDVPVLVDKYSGRERALVVHLDRIYGTTMANEPEMKTLLDTLESTAAEARGRNRRASSGVHSGLQEFGKMTGYLVWSRGSSSSSSSSSSSTSSSFSVLAVDKLLRYQSETAYATEPYNPVESIQIMSVREDESLQDSSAFTVSYRAVVADSDSERRSPPVSPLTLKLVAPSPEQRILWVATIRSGLGVADAVKEKAPPSPQKQASGEASDAADATLRDRLLLFYRENNPCRLAEVDTLLHYFRGRERQLLADLDATYGTQTSTDPSFTRLIRSPPPSPTNEDTPRSPSKAADYESYMQVKHPELGAAFRKCYCVLRGVQWSCYSTSRDAHAATAPLLHDRVVNLHSLNAKLHELRVLSIEGQANGAILLRADASELFHNWSRVLREAADQHLLQTQPQDGQGDHQVSPLEVKVREYYSVHNPAKLAEVATLLQSFEGRELDLLVELDRIYHTQLAADPAVLSLLASPSPSVAQEDTSPAASSILMEGYLVKRGHLVPSMRKRYCVLVKNVLTYYLTHEDSRSSTVQPLGSFRVEIVSDWHGKTTTQVYEHGMELETHDGKTFFCAAFSAEDKTQWMRAFHHGIAIARSEETASGTTTAELEGHDVKAKRAALRERLEAYYRVHNSRKLADLDLLLACYKGREIAMLEAMDATYGTSLLEDVALLALLPPLNAHTQALRKLEYDGQLQRAAGGNSEAAWRHAQPVYVAQKGLSLSFYASREGFKAGAAALSSAADRGVTVLAAKAVDTPSLCRFGIETTDHVWMYFQAPNVVERGHWLDLLRAALDATLASTILEEEKTALDESGTTVTFRIRGYLMIRMDFGQALADFEQQVVATGSVAVDVDVAAKNATTARGRLGLGLAIKPPPRAQDAMSSAMQECYVELRHENELVLFANDDHTRPLATLTALSTQGWRAVGGLSPTSTSGSKYPFQIVTQEQIVLSCGATTDLERAQWIQQIRNGAQRAAAMEMLQEQLDEAKQQDTGGQRKRRQSELDDASGERRGYLFYSVDDGKSGRQVEAFVLVDPRGRLQIYEDESAWLRRDRPHMEAAAVDVESNASTPALESGRRQYLSKLFGGKKDEPQSLSFRVHVVHSVSTQDKPVRNAVLFYPATEGEHQLWVEAIRQAINLAKGEQLLADEKRVLEIEQVTRQTDDDMEDASFVLPSSAMEGELTVWTHSKKGETLFAVLEGCKLRGFPSKSIAATSLSGGESVVSMDIEVISLSDWSPPVSGEEGRGLAIEAVDKSQSAKHKKVTFTTKTSDQRRRWTHAIQHELDFALAEKYLDEDAKEFVRLAAVHVAAETVASTPASTVRVDGYVRVRHQFVGSIWRERFAVVAGTMLWLFQDGGDAVADDWQRRAIETHALLSVHPWQPASTAAARDHAHRHGLCLENMDGAIVELTFVAVEDRDTWQGVVQQALDAAATTREAAKWVKRDPVLAFVPGAAMEGYLSVRERASSSMRLPRLGGRSRGWKTRYAVLIGTQWLLYETQDQAVALHGHNQQQDADDHSGVLPQAVLDIVHADEWSARRKSTSTAVDESVEMASHGFVVVGSKGSATGGGVTSRDQCTIIECKAHTSLERKRWLNALQDQIASVEQEQELVRQALQATKEKESAQHTVKAKLTSVRDDANRQSAFLHDILESFAGASSGSEDEESKDDEEDESKSPTGATARRPTMLSSPTGHNVHSPENSPMYRRRTTSQGRRASQVRFLFDGMEKDPSKAVATEDPLSPTHQRMPRSWWSFQALFACCFDRPPSSTASTAGLAPLKNPRYVYHVYHEDASTTRLLDDEW